MANLLRVGSQSYDLGPSPVADGFFSSLSYRLEPNGRGTRFPLIMGIYAGSMKPSAADAASRELQDAERELSALAPDRAVWSLSDLRRRDDSRLPVNHAAHNLCDYFVAADGRPVLAALRDAIHASGERNEPLLLVKGDRKPVRRAAALLVFGALWTVLGYLYFRNWIMTALGDSEATHGPLAWPLGIVVFASGLTELVSARFPGLSYWFRRRAWVGVASFVSVLALTVWLMLPGFYGPPGARGRERYLEGVRLYKAGQYQDSRKAFEAAAAAKNVTAMAYLGFLYSHGRGVPQDDARAAAWYRQGAEAGDARAMYNLGALYDQGRGVPKDDRQAESWYRKAANAGDTAAMTTLGSMYESGRGGLPKDEQMGLSWFRKAVEKGDPAGMVNLGFLYANGRAGLSKDDEQAVTWYRKAADQGDAAGMANLGYMYEKGRGLPKDDQQALSWYHKAADLGSSYAQKALARMGTH
jgi:TPR repeat protein